MRRFTRSSALKILMLSHSWDKKFECKLFWQKLFCDKAFTQTSFLKDHLLVHTGGKRFQSTIYGSDFSPKESHNKHMLLHTGDRKFKCGSCASIQYEFILGCFFDAKCVKNKLSILLVLKKHLLFGHVILYAVVLSSYYVILMTYITFIVIPSCEVTL